MKPGLSLSRISFFQLASVLEYSAKKEFSSADAGADDKLSARVVVAMAIMVIISVIFFMLKFKLP